MLLPLRALCAPLPNKVGASREVLSRLDLLQKELCAWMFTDKVIPNIMLHKERIEALCGTTALDSPPDLVPLGPPATAIRLLLRAFDKFDLELKETVNVECPDPKFPWCFG